ncbi:MAG: microcompartment protein CcmL/EutN [Myxococcota bacterium]|jgi:microcompartment protein CcmL/EutN
MLDIRDIPRGLLALDLLVKEAEVQLLSAGTVQDGRYLILFGGAVEPTQYAFRRACEAAGAALTDSVLLPWAEDRIVPGILDATHLPAASGDTLGVMQLGSSPTMLRAVDAALKGAHVELLQLRLADGLGGRALATVCGETTDVEAALEVALDAIPARPDWSSAIIRNVDGDVATHVNRKTHFFDAWRG